MSEWKRNRLWVLRAERRLSQRDVADKLGISQSLYCLIETGHREPDAPTGNVSRARLAKALGVRIEDLMPPQEAKAS